MLKRNTSTNSTVPGIHFLLLVTRDPYVHACNSCTTGMNHVAQKEARLDYRR